MANHGTDVWLDGDLRPDMPTVSGRLLLAQAVKRRLETAQGSLSWDPLGADYGYDLRALVATKQRDFRAISQRIVAECEKDDRVEFATATVEDDAASGRLLARITLHDADGPFALTLSVSELTVELLFNGA